MLGPEGRAPDLGHRIDRQQTNRQRDTGHEPHLQIQRRLDDDILRPEARQRREACQREGRDQEQEGQHRGMGVKPAQTRQVGAAADALGDARDKEQVGLHDDVVNEVEDRPHKPERREERKPQHHVADLADDVEGQDAAEIVHRRSAQNARDHRRHRQPQQDRVGEGHVLIEDQREAADQRIDAHLGQQPGEDRRDRDRRRVIRGRQPEEQREQRRLDPEGHHEHHGDRGQQAGVFHLAHGQVQVRHVQRAGDAVKQADPRQEHDRRDEVQRHILDAAIQLFLAAAQHQKAEAGDQHDLEPDIEVEQVARQEGAADRRDQHLKQGVKAQTLQPLGDLGQGVDDRGHRRDRGDHDHDAAQVIGDQRDAEGRLPVRHLPGDDAVFQHLAHHDEAGKQQHHRARDRNPAPGGAGAEQIGQNRRDQRNQDRVDENPAHARASPPVGVVVASVLSSVGSLAGGVPGAAAGSGWGVVLGAETGSATRISSLLTVPRLR